MDLVPQEVELWYVYPSLRKEIANIMIKQYGLKQKEIKLPLNEEEYENDKEIRKELTYKDEKPFFGAKQ